MAPKKKTVTKRKVKKNVPSGVAHIHSSFNNTIVTMSDEKGNRIELIKPMCENSTVNKNSLGLHHLAVLAEDEDELVKTIKEKKLGKIFMDNIKAPLFDNKNVGFGMLKNNLLFEIIYKN